LPTEHQAALAESSVRYVEAILQPEDRFESRTQILASYKSEPAALVDSARHSKQASAIGVRLIVKASINNAVQCDAALTIGGGGKGAERCDRDKRVGMLVH
jgi:hypothetical protein